MTLIKSISGIRGTIGGKPGDNLTPSDTVKFAGAYAQWLKISSGKSKDLHVVIGRDARISGEMASSLVAWTLVGAGIRVTDLGLSTTPSVEVIVTELNADGGIILTASHNPKQWNALKLLNAKGEFISAKEGARLLEIAESGETEFAEVDELGKIERFEGSIEKHIEKILQLPLVDVNSIAEANLSIVVDAVNSSGGIAVPMLLEKLGVKTVHRLYCEPNGLFPHNPEPLPEHLKDISQMVLSQKADMGIVVDPDVDRLAFVSENGEMFGEEYTLVAIADYVLSRKKGNTVSNLSSTRALRDVTEQYGMKYFASAVGEVNVVEKMKAENAVIGGEGNGGIIYPELHYGRDALVGIALFLTHLSNKKMKMSELRNSYPNYVISKNKIELSAEINTDEILQKLEEKYAQNPINKEDGLKIEFENEWVHLRKSNTEPIIRIYAESESAEKADELANTLMQEIKNIAVK